MFRITSIAVALIALFSSSSPAKEGEGGNRYAVLIGIADYEHPKLREPSPLKYPVNDATEVGELLRRYGFEVALFTDTAGKQDAEHIPKKANIEAALSKVFAVCKREDTIVVALAGHGIQFAGESDAYFCPQDARPFKESKDSLISLQKIYSEMDRSFAATKIILVDACRNDPDPGRGRGLNADSAPPPPRGIGALYSCSAGQKAYEHDSLKHGVFFYHVLRGLRGEAANRRDDVTFQSLSDYVATAVQDKIAELFPGRGDVHQVPNTTGNVGGSPLLVRIRDKARWYPAQIDLRQKRAREILAQVKMTLGTTQATSEVDDVERVAWNTELMLAWDYALLGDESNTKVHFTSLMKRLDSKDISDVNSLARVLGVLKTRRPLTPLSGEINSLRSAVGSEQRDEISTGVAQSDVFTNRSPAMIQREMIDQAAEEDSAFTALSIILGNRNLVANAQEELSGTLQKLQRQSKGDDSGAATDNLIIAALKNDPDRVAELLRSSEKGWNSHRRFWVIPFVLRHQAETLKVILDSDKSTEVVNDKWTAAETLLDMGDTKLAAEFARSIVGASVGGAFPAGSRNLPAPTEVRFGVSSFNASTLCRLYGRLGDEDLMREHAKIAKLNGSLPDLYYVDGLLADLPPNVQE